MEGPSFRFRLRGILAVGSTEERVVVENGAFVARPLMTLTLTCDHRAIDGAKAAEFLRELKTLLEEPELRLRAIARALAVEEERETPPGARVRRGGRSEEHTSELQSH